MFNKKKNQKSRGKNLRKKEKSSQKRLFSLNSTKLEPSNLTGITKETKRWVFGILMFLLAAIIILGFFEKAGAGGQAFIRFLNFLIGRAMFVLPLFFVLLGLMFLKNWSKIFRLDKNKKIFLPIILGALILILGIAGVLEISLEEQRSGGFLGYLISWPFLEFFGILAATIIFIGILSIGILIMLQPLIERKREIAFSISEISGQGEEDRKKALSISDSIKKPLMFLKKRAKFKVKEVSDFEKFEEKKSLKVKEEEIFAVKPCLLSYNPPSLDLLEKEKEKPFSGDIQVNSMIIKKTLANFGITVEMGDVNVGPTVAQYTLKPFEGIKLSKITILANDLSLALAVHPIRIEAPIPGQSLVGIEVPNKKRVRIRLRDLMANLIFQHFTSTLTFILGRDVVGKPIFADLKKMPHLLIAGSTGTGKTICLNTLILSLIYNNSPEILRLILIDPKRVEFPVYSDIPHLLTPSIISVDRAVNALRWLVKEMERRFDVLSEAKVKDIDSYNEIIGKNLKKKETEIQEPIMPYIVLIIDELADLMVSRGKEIEAEIVRLAQMSRAVGIHLVIATQRPSVEVITGLIKANITSRIAFQVASQIDSRTILDMAGAEKLLGLGDMFYISSETTKLKRIQGVYVSEKEIKKIAEYFKSEEFFSSKKEKKVIEKGALKETNIQPVFSGKDELFEDLEKQLDEEEEKRQFSFDNYEDSLYNEAREIVIRAKRASASLLQRRLRIGYARAARLLDMMEKQGLIGPADGAKPREVYIQEDDQRADNFT